MNLMDLAPTFLDAAGVTPPEVMTGRSLVDVLRSDASGLVDPARVQSNAGLPWADSRASAWASRSNRALPASPPCEPSPFAAPRPTAFSPRSAPPPSRDWEASGGSDATSEVADCRVAKTA